MIHERGPVESIAYNSPAPLAPEHIELDKPQDECGVFGIYAPGEAVGVLAYRAGVAQEHRGLSGSGIAYTDAALGEMVLRKDIGKMRFAIPDMAPRHGWTPADAAGADRAIVHNRYSTDKSNEAAASQPFIGRQTDIAVAHNGHINGIEVLARRFKVDSSDTISDSDLLAQVIDQRYAETGDIETALTDVLKRTRGAYCLTIAYQDGIIGVRDPAGYHPLSLATFPDGKRGAIASEDSTFWKAGVPYQHIRQVERGEMVFIGPHGIKSAMLPHKMSPKYCIYEIDYTSKEDSNTFGVNNLEARLNLGRELAKVAPVKADIVVGVPDTGRTHARGYAEASGIPAVNAVKKNPGASRTFILREEERAEALAKKFEVQPELLAGKRVVLVDDSMIKGNTMRQLVSQLWKAGVEEIHFRSAGPRYEHSCKYGMDTSNNSELIAQPDRDNQTIARELGVNSVAYNSFENFERACDEARIDPRGESLYGKFCDSCCKGEAALPHEQEAAEGQFRNLGHAAVVAA